MGVCVWRNQGWLAAWAARRRAPYARQHLAARKRRRAHLRCEENRGKGVSWRGSIRTCSRVQQGRGLRISRFSNRYNSHPVTLELMYMLCSHPLAIGLTVFRLG